MEVRDLEVLAWRLFEESNDAVFVLHPETETILQANPTAQRLTGLRWRQLSGRRLGELVQSEHDRQLKSLLSAVWETGFFHSQEDYLLCRHQLEPLPINISVSRIHTPSGELGLVIARDVSDRKRAELALRSFNHELERQVRVQTEELQELNASLERRIAERTADLNETNAELTVFARTVSHDLRAPLRAIEGFATALAEDYSEQIDEAGHEFIQHIVDSTQRMAALVSDLLAFSQLGRTELRLDAIELNSVVTDALRQLKSEIVACNAEVDVAEQMPTVLGQQATLVQVITNLLSNGMKFVAQGVRPEVRIWAQRKDDGKVRLWVEDNGIGIAEAHQDRIFQAFERLHGIESYPGTGIGLAIVARACERLGGRYGLDSQSGQGSRFWAEFAGGESNP